MNRTQNLAVLAALLLGISSPTAGSAGDDPKVSIKVQTDDGEKVEISGGAGFLSGLVGGADVRCEADRDDDSRRMMASLERQGEGGIYRGEDDDGGRYVARRKNGALRIDKTGENGERTLVEMPWDVARCLISGIDPPGDLGRRLARGEARLRFETSSKGSVVSIRLE